MPAPTAMAEADDGTAPATGEDAAATPEAGAAEDAAGADTMAEVERRHRARYRGRCGGHA